MHPWPRSCPAGITYKIESNRAGNQFGTLIDTATSSWNSTGSANNIQCVLCHARSLAVQEIQLEFGLAFKPVYQSHVYRICTQTPIARHFLTEILQSICLHFHAKCRQITCIPMANPTSARLRAGASLVPSPVTATTCGSPCATLRHSIPIQVALIRTHSLVWPNQFAY
jgi:hypothetical protein